jgi:hypothetical protein
MPGPSANLRRQFAAAASTLGLVFVGCATSLAERPPTNAAPAGSEPLPPAPAGGGKHHLARAHATLC